MHGPTCIFLGQPNTFLAPAAEPLKLVEMSVHDGNLLALASLLAVDISPPCFVAHWLFELHRSESEWTIRVFYVPDPTHMSEAEYVRLVPRRLPLDGKYLMYEECTVDRSSCGVTPAEQLIDYLTCT